MKVLIIDDDKSVRETLKMVCSLFGMQAEQAASGEEALILVKHQAFDLIVLDMVMPGLSGIDVLRRLRQDEKNRLIPVIVLSGETSPEFKVRALSLGAVDYLIKPFDLEAFRRSVQHARRMDQGSEGGV